MNNRQDVLGIIANIALVVLLFCFIVAGLNIIGIYSLPAPVEKLLGTYDDRRNTNDVDDNILYNSVSFDEGQKTFEKVSIGYEDARIMLESLEAVSDYSQSLEVNRYNGPKKRSELLNISYSGGLYTVDFCNVDGSIIKRVSEDIDYVTITEYNDESSDTVRVEKGNFNINEECGFILTASDFLNSGYNLSEGDFLYTQDENGVFVTLNFEDDNYGILQRLKYVISLDTGIVTEAYCYENETPVYDMISSSISTSV